MNIQTLRNIIYRIILFGNWFLPLKEHEVIILCYHSIANDAWRFSVPMTELKKQIKYLLKTRQPLSLPEFENYLAGKLKLTRPAFIITFDDGYKDILQTLTFFKENNVKPAVFVLAEPAEANRVELETNKAFLSNSDIKKLSAHGWSIGSHSATHANFACLSMSAAEHEIIYSKMKLQSALNMPIKYFAYPKGKYNKKIGECVKIADYNIAFTMDDGRIRVGFDSHLIPRIGVDGTHGFAEYRSAITPLAILCRNLVKKHWSST